MPYNRNKVKKYKVREKNTGEVFEYTRTLYHAKNTLIKQIKRKFPWLDLEVVENEK